MRAPASVPGVGVVQNHTGDMSLIFRAYALLASALALFMARVLADDHYATVPANYLAPVADLLDARHDLHGESSAAAHKTHERRRASWLW